MHTEPTRDIQAFCVGVFLILVLLFFAYRLVQSVDGWFEFLAVIPLAIVAAGVSETYKAWQKVPREKA